jgi:hypothetical protein
VLGEQLASAESIDSALTRYQELWQPVITEKQQVARRGVGWFLPSSSLQLWLRRLVLKLTSLPGVDSYVGTRLVGKSHDHVGLRQGSSIESDAQSCTMEDPAGAALERAATSSSSG